MAASPSSVLIGDTHPGLTVVSCHRHTDELVHLLSRVTNKLHVFFTEKGCRDCSPCQRPVVIFPLQLPVEKLAWQEEMGTHRTLQPVTAEFTPMLQRKYSCLLSLLSRATLGFYTVPLCAAYFVFLW